MSAYPPPPPPLPPPDDQPLRTSETIQGNVLAAFNKDHQSFFLLGFPPDQAATRAWLSGLVPMISTTAEVASFNDQFSVAREQLPGDDDPATLTSNWAAVSFTPAGLRRLTAEASTVDSAFGFSTSFLQGPLANAPDLGDVDDSDPATWIFGATAQPEIDCCVTLAADRAADLRKQVRAIRALGSQHGIVEIARLEGETLPGVATGHEHFGFKDGISQPGVRGFDKPSPQDPTQVDGHPGQDLVDANQFILGQQGGDDVQAWLQDGSFQVLRRLAQDVPGFWDAVERNAPQANLTPDTLAAKCVGRWKSGASVANHPDEDPAPNRRTFPEDNDFDYSTDPDGTTTPRFAHIRKMYPRASEPPGEDVAQQHRILRRGIPFGKPFDPSRGVGEGVDDPRGLIFNMFSSSIERSFEFLQKVWANNANFPVQGDGPDPIIGANPNVVPVTLPSANGNTTEVSFQRFVKTTGSVYAFAPSIPTLNALAAGQI